MPDRWDQKFEEMQKRRQALRSKLQSGQNFSSAEFAKKHMPKDLSAETMRAESGRMQDVLRDLLKEEGVNSPRQLSSEGLQRLGREAMKTQTFGSADSGARFVDWKPGSEAVGPRASRNEQNAYFAAGKVISGGEDPAVNVPWNASQILNPGAGFYDLIAGRQMQQHNQKNKALMGLTNAGNLNNPTASNTFADLLFRGR